MKLFSFFRSLISFGFLFMGAALHAGFTPGHYEIQTLGGQSIGELTVKQSTATFNEKPATHIDWLFDYSMREQITEHHEAYVDAAGLLYFRQEVKDAQGTMVAESQKDIDKFNIFVNDHGRKLAMAVPLKGLDVSEYELETPRSKFWGLKLKEAASANVLVINQLAVVRTRRNVNELTVMPFGRKKKVDVFVINTNFSGTIVTSWITTDTHVLLQERWGDRQFIRLER